MPLSDFGGQGASIQFKAWVCTNPECGYNIKIRNGDVYLDWSRYWMRGGVRAAAPRTAAPRTAP